LFARYYQHVGWKYACGQPYHDAQQNKVIKIIKKGMKSGIKSIGLKTYAAINIAMIFTCQGVVGFLLANQTVMLSRAMYVDRGDLG
jgi:hypothetical protein